MGSAKRLILGVAALVLVTTTAHADDDDPRELSKRGYELLVVGKCDDAIPLFKKSAPSELIVNPTIRSAVAAGIDLNFTP